MEEKQEVEEEIVLKQNTSPEFMKWWLGYYGGPEQYAFDLPGECQEYHTRKYFAWQGWQAQKRQDVLTPFELTVGIFNYSIYILDRIAHWVWYDVLRRSNGQHTR